MTSWTREILRSAGLLLMFVGAGRTIEMLNGRATGPLYPLSAALILLLLSLVGPRVPSSRP